MPRIIAIDYGTKRTGIAATDELQIIASPLTTVETKQLIAFLNDYISREPVAQVVVGEPKKVNGQESENMPAIRQFIAKFQQAQPNIPITLYDERFTTKLAFQAMLQGGLNKKQRNNKNGVVDKVSASIILQSFMDSQRNKL